MSTKSIYAGDASSIYATNTMFPKDIATPENLEFDLAAPSAWEYTPGDTIIGHLIRKNPLTAPESTVRVWFAGRVRTKIWRDKNSRYGTDIYDEQWNLLHGAQDVIHDGPLHHPENNDKPLSWPISVQIPTRPSESVREGHTATTSFISLEKPPPFLPGTFSAYGSNFNMKSEGVVEYAIHARLNYIHRGAHKVLYTTSPIALRHPIDLEVCLDKTIKYHNYYPMKIQSQRLLPGMEDAKLSLGQKTHKLFHSSKVPEFWYELSMEIPTAIQLCRQNPLPLSFSFIHREDKSSDNIKHHPQKIQVNWVKLRLHCITAVMAPSNLRTNYAQKDQITNEMNLYLEKLFEDLESPLVINSTEKRNGPINLGNMFQLNLRYDGLYAADRRLVHMPSINRISADFMTYGIKHTHALEPSVNLSIAGEEQTIKFEPQQIQVIAPS